MTQIACYRWRKEFGGLKTDQVKRLKELAKDRSIEPPLMEWRAPGIAMYHIGCCHSHTNEGSHRRRSDPDAGWPAA